MQWAYSVLFKNPRWVLIIASGIFGAAHFRGGLIYVGMATFSGICYGSVYQETQRLSCAMRIHFSLNLIHILFFTYPVFLSWRGVYSGLNCDSGSVERESMRSLGLYKNLRIG